MNEEPTVRGERLRVALRALSGLLAVVFMLSGASKLQGAEEHVRDFDRWGYPDWLRIAVGAVQVASAVLLPVPRTTFVGAVALAVLMAGGTYAHWASGEGGRAVLTLVLLALLSLLAYARRPQDGLL